MTYLSNEIVFGPLQLKGEFNYEILNNCEKDNELLKYIQNIDKENHKKTKIMDIIDNAVFIRVIKLDLGHIHPIIGLFTVKILNYSYNISHISVHKSFRRQGLAKMLVTCFANHLNSEINTNSLVTCFVSDEMENIVELFRSLKFNEIAIDTDYHMLKPTKYFIKLIESPINMI